ncbi:MAG: Crp/Fnr family transcriptional regulator [Clostridia bacterium]|nr:Crp/Fnr family transcriptional regulator [Clostridia bacterium]
MDNILSSLKTIPLFIDLKEEELSKIAGLVKIRNYKKNMIIFMEGEPGDGLHFVKSGRVKIAKSSEDGREQILHFLQEGDIFAEVVLFDGGPYPATAEVLEDAQIGIIRNQDLDKLIKENSDIALRLLKVMAKKLRLAQMAIKELALRDTFGRVVGILLKLVREYGEPGPEGTVIRLPLSRQELANYVGTTRETVTRILGDLKKSKVITIDKQTICVIDEAKLKSWL